MPTLAQTLSTTTPVSVLLRKARRYGLIDLAMLVSLAVQRGCRHYAGFAKVKVVDPGRDSLCDEELVILLLVGEHPFSPVAIRCAAQMAKSPGVRPVKLATLAKMEKTERVLGYIARAGLKHDPSDPAFWKMILENLPSIPIRSERQLPHWTRFVSVPGKQKGGSPPAVWLNPSS